MTNKVTYRLLALIFAIVILLSAVSCNYTAVPDRPAHTSGTVQTLDEHLSDKNTEGETDKATEGQTSENPSDIVYEVPALTLPAFTPPKYNNSEYCNINDGVPYFTENQVVTDAYEYYSELDNLGRCGTAVACLGKELMPTDQRGSISSVSPSGWCTSTDKDGNSIRIYERSHLLGWQLTGENANKKNLITGTYDLNGVMQTFEDMITAYIKETNNHVMYRVTPIFEGDNLLSSGVLMEAYSVEDNGEGICFNIYIFNTQPDYDIDYKTGAFKLSENSILNQVTYVINKRNSKYHKPTCNGVSDMSEANKILYFGTKEELLAEYPNAKPCGTCKP